LRNALISAERLSDNALASAKREAQTIIEAARVEQERMQFEASKLPEALMQEIKQLREMRDRLRSEMVAVLSTHRVFLDSLLPAEEIRSSPDASAGENNQTENPDTNKDVKEEKS